MTSPSIINQEHAPKDLSTGQSDGGSSAQMTLQLCQVDKRRTRTARVKRTSGASGFLLRAPQLPAPLSVLRTKSQQCYLDTFLRLSQTRSLITGSCQKVLFLNDTGQPLQKWGETNPWRPGPQWRPICFQIYSLSIYTSSHPPSEVYCRLRVTVTDSSPLAGICRAPCNAAIARVLYRMGNRDCFPSKWLCPY